MFFLLSVYIGVEFPACTAILWLTFWGTVKSFFKVAASFFTPISNAGGLTVSLHHCQHLPAFLTTAILVDMNWYAIVVLVYIYLTSNNVKHFFMSLLTRCLSLEKCLFRCFVHFFYIGLFIFILLNCRNSSYILDISICLLSDTWFENISYFSVGCFSHF